MAIDTDCPQSQLGPGPDTSLTPHRLSIFYRSVGGDDFVFRELGYPGLSLMYQILGCFHSLQPTANAFGPPMVPCLLPLGFVRWQTLQLLLYPEEHAQCIQRAVELYDVPKPDGGIFPKILPRESFPSKPDEAMEKWHSTVLERLDGGHHRLKNSPYNSPYDVSDRGDGYFARHGGRSRRTSRPPRTDNQDLPHHLSPTSRRRSSVPSVPSSIQPPDHGDHHYWSSDQAFRPPDSPIPHSPRHRSSNFGRTQRPLSQTYHGTSNSNTTSNTATKSFHLNFENFHIPFLSSPFSSTKNRERSSTSAARRHAKSRSEAVSTGSEASSEDSLPRIPKYDQHHRRGSLAPPTDYNPFQRRHSHDASYLPTPKYKSARPSQPPRSSNDHHPYAPVPQTAPIPNLFHPDPFTTGSSASTAPKSLNGPPLNPQLRVIDPMGRKRPNDPGRDYAYNGADTLQGRRAVSAERRGTSSDRRNVRSADGNHDADRVNMRREGTPLRVNTVAGGGAARHARQPEVRSAGMPNLRRVPPRTLSGGGRR